MKDNITEEMPEEKSGISLGEIAILAKRYSFLIILITVVFAIIGVVYARYFVKTTYSTSAKVMIMADYSENEGTNFTYATRLVSSFQDFIKTEKVRKAFIAKAIEKTQQYKDQGNVVVDENGDGIDDTLFDVNYLSGLSYSGKDDSMIFQVSYSTVTGAKQAVRTVNLLLDCVKETADTKITNSKGEEEYEYSYFGNKVRILDYSEYSGEANNGTKYIIIFAIAGLVIACALVLVRYLLDDTVKTKEELERITGVNLLAYIEDVEEAKAGKR